MYLKCGRLRMGKKSDKREVTLKTSSVEVLEIKFKRFENISRYSGRGVDSSYKKMFLFREWHINVNRHRNIFIKHKTVEYTQVVSLLNRIFLNFFIVFSPVLFPKSNPAIVKINNQRTKGKPLYFKSHRSTIRFRYF